MATLTLPLRSMTYPSLVPHVAEVAGYNLGMYVGDTGQAAVARAAETFFIGLRQPMRILAWSTPATIEPALQNITGMMQECGPQETWRVVGLDEQFSFLTDLAQESDLRRNHFYLCTWANSPQTPQALWGTASSRLLCSVRPQPTLPQIFAGHWHAAFDHLWPYPDSPDQSYVGFYYVYNFLGNWTLESLHPLFQQPFPVALVVDVDTLSSRSAGLRTQNAHNSLAAQMIQQTKLGSVDPGSTAAFQDVKDVSALLETGRRIHMTRMALAIRARTRAELNEHYEAVAGALAGLCEIAPAWGQQKGLFPFFTTTHRNLITDPLPDWPWLSGGVGVLTGLFGLPSRNDTRGPLYGIEDYSGNMIFHDMFARPDESAGNVAGHAVVLGQTGSGKTLLLNMIARRSALYGRQVVVIEPQGHSERLYDLLGPEACAYHPLDFASSRINILDRAFANPQSQITGVVNLLTLLLSCSVGAKNTESEHARHFATGETQTLYRALGQIYRPFPWDRPLPPEQAPLLEDLCTALASLGTPEGDKLADEIGGLFVDSELSAIFNAHTNVDLSFRHRAICFNVHEIDETFRPWIYAVLFQRLIRYIYARNIAEAGYLLVQLDEARHLLNEPLVGHAVRDTVKRVRTRGAALWLADQDISTYTNGEIGQQILSNSPLVFFGRMEGNNIEQIQPLFPRLTEWHTQGIITARPGNFVFKCNDEYYQLRVEPSAEEFQILSGS